MIPGPIWRIWRFPRSSPTVGIFQLAMFYYPKVFWSHKNTPNTGKWTVWLLLVPFFDFSIPILFLVLENGPFIVSLPSRNGLFVPKGHYCSCLVVWKSTNLVWKISTNLEHIKCRFVTNQICRCYHMFHFHCKISTNLVGGDWNMTFIVPD